MAQATIVFCAMATAIRLPRAPDERFWSSSFRKLVLVMDTGLETCARVVAVDVCNTKLRFCTKFHVEKTELKTGLKRLKSNTKICVMHLLGYNFLYDKSYQFFKPLLNACFKPKLQYFCTPTTPPKIQTSRYLSAKRSKVQPQYNFLVFFFGFVFFLI